MNRTSEDDVLDGELKALEADIETLAHNMSYNTAFLLLDVGLLMDRYINIHAARNNQNRSRMSILFTLVYAGGILKPSDIAKMTSRATQTITQGVDKLERDGLVRRHYFDKDRRTKKVSMTKKGIELVKQVLPETLEMCNRAVPSLGEQHLNELNSMLRQWRKHLGELVDMSSLVEKGE